MSRTIDERILEMRFDNGQFERGVQTSLSTLDKLKRSLNMDGAADGIDNVGKAVKDVDFSPMSRAVEAVGSKFSAFEVMAVTALANITNSAVNTGKRIVNALSVESLASGFKEYETQINAVQTILANTSSKGTTLNQVNSALDELNHYADMTIYNFTEMTRNIGTFTAAGVDLDTSVAAIKGIANLAAVSGSTSQQASTAMYQLSQALASGTVKLQDWNSVVNAGMGGQVFQDALKETARVHGIAIDKMIKTEGSFRETLKNGWLSSDILTETLQKFTGDLTQAQLMEQGYTEEQAKAILEMGETANDAATKVKTFTQLVDTLKEAAQSGWTESWETIVGDFEEAKALWSEIGDVIGDMINSSANARNELLSGAFDSGWSQFLNEGIADTDNFKQAIVEAAKQHGVSFQKIVENSESFEDSLKQGWLTADILSDSVASLTEKTAGLSDEELKNLGYTREQIEALEKLNRSIQDGTLDVEEYAGQIGRLSGRENLIQSFWNTWNAFFADTEEQTGLITAIKEAFRDIFPATTSEQLYKLTENLKNFTERFKMSGETVEKLKSTFKGLFAVLDIVKQAFSAVWRGATALLGAVSGLGGGVLGLTGSLGDWLVKLDGIIRESDVFNKAIQGIVSFVLNLKESIQSFLGVIQKKIQAPGLELFHGLLQRVGARITQIGEAAGGMSSGVTNAFQAMGQALADCKFFQLLSGLWNVVKQIAAGIGKVLGTLAGDLSDKLKNANFNGIVDLFNGVALGGILVVISKVVKKIKSAVDVGAEFKDKIKGILDSVRGSLDAFQNQLNAKILLTIASAIAILTASLTVLSLIDSVKLAASLGAVTALFTELMASMAILNKIGGANIKKLGGPMMALSASILILSLALKQISGLNPEELVVGLIGIAGLLAMTAGFVKLLGAGGQTAIKGAAQMVIFSAAIKILAGVCEDLAQLEWEELCKGLVGVGVLLAEVALFLKVAKFDEKAVATAAGIVILSVAIKVLASACHDMNGMSWEELCKGLVGVGALLAELAIFTNLAGNAKNVLATGISLIAIAAAMKLFASVCRDFGNMSWTDLAKALTGVGAALAEVAAAVNFMPKNMIGIGAGLVIVGAALEIIANVLSKLGSMSPETIATSVVVLGAALAELAAGLNFMKGTLGASAAMLVAAGALAVLTPVLSVLGGMSIASLAKGLLTIAGAFAVLGVAGAVLGPLVPSILGLAGAFALIGAGVLVIGAGLLAAGTGLTALVAGISALGISLVGAIAMIPVLAAKLGDAVVEFAKAIAKGAPELGKAVKTVVFMLVGVLVECVPAIADGALRLVAGVLDALAAHTPQIVDSLFQFLIGLLEGIAKNLPGLITAAMDVLMAFFSGITDALSKVDTDALLKGIVGVGLLSLVMRSLSSIAGSIPGAMIGVLGVGAVLAELTLVLAGIGALAQIPGLGWLVDEGGKLLESVGRAIGSFLGGIIGGIAEGASNSFPKVGTNLSKFMENIQPFLDGASRIDPEMMDGVKALAETILVLTAADLLQSLTSWLTGGPDFEKFAEQIVPFGEAMVAYSDAVAGKIDGDAVTASANAGLALAELASKLPNSGGVAGWFMGENDIGDFAEQIIPFGEAMAAYSNAVTGKIDVDAVTASANAGLSLAELASKLPNSGGVAGWFMGENDLGDFAVQLVLFGKAMASYSDAVTGKIDVDAVTASANAGLALAELATNLPNSGGLVSWFTGNNDLDDFGKKLIAFGMYFAGYAEHIEGIEPAVITASAEAAQALAELAKGLPEKGGWFSDNSTLDGFGAQLDKFGAYFSRYYDHISGIDTAQLNAAIASTDKLINTARRMGGVDTEVVNGFGQALTNLGKAGVDGFCNAFSNGEVRAVIAVSTWLSNVKQAICERFDDLYAAGKYLVEGFINGIKDNIYRAEDQARIMAANVNQAVRDELGIHSPAYKLIEDGWYVSEGLAVGIEQNTNPEKAGEEKGRRIRESIEKGLGPLSYNVAFRKDTAGAGPGKPGYNVAFRKDTAVAGPGPLSYNVAFRKDTAEIDMSGQEWLEWLGINTSQVGSDAVDGLANGIGANTSAEKAAKSKGKKVTDAFKEGLDRLELEMTAKDLELELWNATDGVSASERLKEEKEVESLLAKLPLQQKRVDLAYREYQRLLKSAGAGADATKEAYNKWLQEQTALANIQNEIANIQRTSAESAAEAAEQTVELQYGLWEKQNTDRATQAQKNARQTAYLTEKLSIQAKRTAQAEQSYHEAVQAYGESSREAAEAQNAYLEELTAQTDLQNQIVAIQKSSAALLSENLDKAEENIELRYGLKERQESENWSGLDAAANSLEQLSAKLYIQDRRVAEAERAYNEAVKLYGENSNEALQAQNEYLDAMDAQASLQNQIAGIKKDEAARNREAAKTFYQLIAENGKQMQEEFGANLGDVYKWAAKESGFRLDGDQFLLDAEESGKKLAEGIVTGFENQTKQELAGSGEVLLQGLGAGLTAGAGQLAGGLGQQGAAQLGNALAQGLTGAAANGSEDAAKEAEGMAAMCAKRMGNQREAWTQCAANLVQGFIEGVQSKAEAAANEAASMALGAYEAAVRAIENADCRPEITPVLDLSEAEAQARRLSAAFNRAQAATIAARMAAEDWSAAASDGSAAPVYQFVQNNYSPKALPHLEIYRQTKNQFAALKRAIRR